MRLTNTKLSKFLIFTVILSFSSCKNTAQETAPETVNESPVNNNELVLLDFNNTLDETNVKTDDANFEVIKDGNSSKLKVSTNSNIIKPGLVIHKPKSATWDLNGYYQVKADVTNIGDEEMQVEFYVGNDPDELIKWYCSDYADLKPNESKTITVNLAWSDWIHQPQLDIVGMRGTPGKLKTDIDAIDQISFYSRYAKVPNQFTVNNVRAVGKLKVKDTANFFPFIDQYGQYIHKDWKGKTHTDEELKKSAEKEYAALNANPEPKNRNKYGGWTKGPKLKATGFFRTEKHDGKWWMVDPEGYLFWSNGVNCVSSDAVFTGIEHREKYFTELPAKNGPYGQFYTVSNHSTHGFYHDKTPYDTYNFYQANLYRKYGDNWLEKFRELSHKRMRSWGLNTIGFVSDNGALAKKKTPYVGSIWINDTPKIEGSVGFWGKFHDVFDPKFKKAVKSSVASQKYGAGDPWCIGYFIDNEMAWGSVGSLAIGALRSPATQPAKIEFIKDLKKKYGSVKKLNDKWGTTHASWDALLKTTTPPDETKAKEDLVVFYEKIADTYFRTIKEGLNTIAPNQNYLGCRFAWANNDVVLTSASKYMDIMSFNKYEYSVENVGLPKGVDKPIMIGEFHFGATDRGHYHAGVKSADSQADRGVRYEKYMKGALQNPLIVGAHYFQYLDQPLTGRFDGENYNIGCVDICDKPYEEFLSKVKEVGHQLFELRSSK
ncbi:hypothetical protein [Aquimarina agarivorans]|uniref:hypothetical protein n=1 Tax=Aquimarina agarivorans TaxID=980584 RepID=UPI000248F85F|nr:hypothetical protein [Aquimarina agarivorans]